MSCNRYFIINNDDPNKEEIITFSVGSDNSQRYNIAGNQLVVKLCEGDHLEHPQLQQYEEYEHEQILEALNNIEWTLPL